MKPCKVHDQLKIKLNIGYLFCCARCKKILDATDGHGLSREDIDPLIDYAIHLRKKYGTKPSVKLQAKP